MPLPIRYNGGLNCSLAVTDLKRSIAWYQDVLGFELIYKLESPEQVKGAHRLFS
jgi:catechol 2,3-dioxygenase-like lactoylglutathione lyase family enzyme